MQHSSNGEKRLSFSHFFHLLTLQLAVRNALRYFPEELHSLLGPEFRQELQDYGHIYMYRLMPSLAIKAYPISHYPAKTRTAAAIMHMMMNNLDPQVAQFPQELVTYGGNGQVLSNWAQVISIFQFPWNLHIFSLMKF